MQTYQLIAFDMDGTLLNSEKQILPSSLTAISRAAHAGKTVILSTGRSAAEVAQYLEQLPDVRYLNCISGALVFDTKTQTVLYRHPLPTETCLQILRVAEQEDVMIYVLTEKSSILQRSHYEHLEHYGMGRYQGLFSSVATIYDDLPAWYRADPFPLSKINLNCPDRETFARIEAKLKSAGICAAIVDAGNNSWEINADGVNKAVGLRQLCAHLRIPLSQTIAVGDTGNDYEVMKAAGLSIAMGNATGDIRSLAGAQVSDCDHDGCAEAIEKYLLA